MSRRTVTAFLRPLAAGALACFLLPGPGGPASAEEPFTPFMSPDQEVEVGRKEHPKILAQFGGVYDDPAIGGYVAVIGGSLVANTELPRYPYTFTVLNSPVVNAFALPGGYVYVSRGLLALANSEAELAGVLAHEIGHVTARHAAQRYSRNVIAGIGAAVLGILTDSPQLNQIAQVGSALYLSSYSREQEYEADILGVRYLGRTGYNSWAPARFLESLDAQHSLAGKLAGREAAAADIDFFATHPRTPDRIRAAIQAASESGGRVDGPLRRPEYLREIDGLLYGDDPEQGFVRGRVFSHPKLRFTFTAPPDFQILNDAKAVLARGPGGAVIRFDGERRAGNQPMEWYLTRVWSPRLPLREVEPLVVNGMAAATGTARVDGPQGPIDIRLIAIRFDGSQIFRFLFASRPDMTGFLRREFLRTTYSLRRLTAVEASALKPLRLRIVPVRQGDTAHSLAATMALRDHALERFRVLNGLRAGQQPKVGDMVKVVRE